MEITFQSTTSRGRVYTSVKVFTRSVLTSHDVHPQAELDETEDAAATLPCRISFKFSASAFSSSGWIVTPNTTYSPFCSETYVLLNLHDLLNYHQARQTLLEMIEDWPVREEARQMFVGFALDEARRAVQSKPDSHNFVDIHVRMLVVRTHVFYQRLRASPSAVAPPPADHQQHPPTLDDVVIQRSIDAHEVRMTPADDSSIESLEGRKILAMDSTETCPICLENVCLDTKTVCMACSHLFHENCINKWLRISNNCPVCRFQLPA